MDEKRNVKAYRLIEKTATSNASWQGFSGLLGFPATVIADVVTVGTHYQEMINSIRILYDKKPLNENIIIKIVKGIKGELLYDIMFDKFLGNVPIAGIYFNAICAKTMTWRIGLLTAIISSRGEKIDVSQVKKVMKLIRNVFPQNDMFKFAQPNFNNFEKLVNSANNNSIDEFDKKVDQALEAFGIDPV